MGILSAVSTKGKEVFSFEYDNHWLKSDFTQIIDPGLQLYSGRYFPGEDKVNFGVFLDSCPDGNFLNDNINMAVPPRTSLHKLENVLAPLLRLPVACLLFYEAGEIHSCFLSLPLSIGYDSNQRSFPKNLFTKILAYKILKINIL